MKHDRALRAVPARQVVLAELAALRGRDRLRDGLPDAARAPHAARSRSSCRSGCSISSCARSRSSACERPGTGTRSSRRSTTTTTWSTRARTPTARRSGSTSSCPGPEERAWLRAEVPARRGRDFDPIWERITERWRAADPGNDFAVHGTAIVDVLRSVPARAVRRHAARRTPRTSWTTAGAATSSARSPCRWIFEQEPERYAGAQGRRQARARGRGAREPGGAGAALLRARLRDLGQGRVRRRLSLAATGAPRP